MIEPIPFAGNIEIGEEMTLVEEALKLADDISEYAPNTNIELMIRDLVKEVIFLQKRVIELSTEDK